MFHKGLHGMRCNIIYSTCVVITMQVQKIYPTTQLWFKDTRALGEKDGCSDLEWVWPEAVT